MRCYSPEAHRWCLEKKLTMLGNTDSHVPIQPQPGQHRTMTLVFARNATVESIREALVERRTAVYHNEYVIGEEKYLKELFEKALEWKIQKVENTENNVHIMNFTFKNKSDFTFLLKKTNHDPRLVYFRYEMIEPQSERSFYFWMDDSITGGDLNFCVENFLVQPNKGMAYTIKVDLLK
jgi:hypothetical protein